jgi:hypothetical protein
VAPYGGEKRTIDYRILENDRALNDAIQDFKNNWYVYKTASIHNGGKEAAIDRQKD